MCLLLCFIYFFRAEQKPQFSKTNSATDFFSRRRSAPEDFPASKTVSAMPTWIKNELDNAEHLPTYNSAAEQRLLTEIEQVKKRLHEQSLTFREHEKQLSILQKKMAELQILQKMNNFRTPNEPPPAYGGVATPRPKAALRNTFLPNAAKTRICAIM